MCGLVAVFGAITVPQEKAFKNMLVFDQVRGEHSTGVAFVPKGTNDPIVTKVVGTPDNLFETRAFEKAMSGSHRALVGHNRYATVGKVNRANAHPFTCDHITGVHNGSLRSYNSLEGYGSFDVDSNILYNHISKKGLKDAVNNTDGAMALIWWDERESTLNFYRNHERPLHYAMTKDLSACFLASEDWMIWAACSRNNIAIGDVNVVPVDTLFSFELPQNKYTGGLPKPKVTQIVKPKPPAKTYYLPPAGGNKQQKYVGLPKQVVVTFCGDDNHLVHGYRYAYFYEDNGSRESRDFIMPYDTFIGKNIQMGDSFLVDSNGLIRERDNEFYKINVEKMVFVAGNFGYAAEQTPVEQTTNGVDAPAEEEPTEGPFLDWKDNDIGETAWYRLYGCCAYCNGDVDHRSKFRFNSVGGVYCDECLSDAVLAANLPV